MGSTSGHFTFMMNTWLLLIQRFHRVSQRRFHRLETDGQQRDQYHRATGNNKYIDHETYRGKQNHRATPASHTIPAGRQ